MERECSENHFDQMVSFKCLIKHNIGCLVTFYTKVCLHYLMMTSKLGCDDFICNIVCHKCKT